MDLLDVKHFPSGSVKNMIDFLLSLCRGEFCCNSVHFVRIKTKIQAGSAEQNGMQAVDVIAFGGKEGEVRFSPFKRSSPTAGAPLFLNGKRSVLSNPALLIVGCETRVSPVMLLIPGRK